MTNDDPRSTANTMSSNVGPLRPPVDFEDDEYVWPPGELLSPAAQVELEAKLGIHWVGCWASGPRHYQCAVAEINRLRQMEDELRALLNRGKNL